MATDNPIEGFDISKWQGSVKWPELREAGRAFAFARVSDGLHVLDPCFEANWRGLREAGLIRGAYQFFRASQDPLQQAELLLSHLGTLGPGDLPPALDIELTDGQDVATVITRALAWLRHVEERLGRKPLVYTSPGIWNGLHAPQDLSAYPLWVAHYGVSQPRLPEGWKRWTFWQYSQSGQLPGIAGAVDLNRFNGSLEELRALAGLSSPDAAPASVTAPPAPAPPRPVASTSTEAASMPHVSLSPPPAPPQALAPLSLAGTPRKDLAPVVAPDTAPALPDVPPQAVGEAPSGEASLDTLLHQRLVSPLSDELQKELAQLVGLREQAASLLGAGAVRQVEMGLLALLGEKPNLPFAQSIREQIALRVADRTHPLRLPALLRTDSPPLQVLLGLGALLVCVALLGGMAHWRLLHAEWTLFHLPPRLLLLAAVGGAVGSVASILVRIRDFEQARGAPPISLVLLGFSKPVVGACFALFVLAVLNAQLLPIQVPAEGPTQSSFFLALSFASGFSERLAQDLVARLEEGLLPEDKPEGARELAPATSRTGAPS